ncbi:MAG: hypothetical protein GY750_17685 [Lentisphaerae bacterium]|nr:hypothetical protein [Lentisphaerota bacterium]MCP4103231.1 hypothetical protein [Lentisphaerota bacterium]
MIYYRSDTRSPETIFKEGFKHRDLSQFSDSPQEYEEDIKDWSIFNMVNPKGHLKNKQSVDAYTAGGICLTTVFETASIFPVTEGVNTYIYAISLPDPIDIELGDFERITPETLAEKVLAVVNLEFQEARNIPNYRKYSGINRKVFNLNSLQYQQASELLKNKREKSYDEALKAGWALYGAEAITAEVKPQDICFAVECMNRRRLETRYEKLGDRITEFQLGRFVKNTGFRVNRGDSNDMNSDYRRINGLKSRGRLRSLGIQHGHVWSL